MPTFTYRGRMIPEWLELSLDYSPTIDRTEREGDEPVRFHAKVGKGRVVVVTETAGVDESLHHTLFLPALDMAHALADAAWLQTGKAFIAVFDDVVLPSGEVMPLVLADARLRDIFGPLLRDNFEAVADLAILDVRVGRLLSDAKAMLTWPHYAPIAAGRVAEAILQLLTGGRAVSDWAAMRETLRVDRPYLQLLADRSAPPRHGNRQYVPAEVNTTLGARAWTLLERYLAFRIGGALDPEKYPVLTG
jgi:hypothetical protein